MYLFSYVILVELVQMEHLIPDSYPTAHLAATIFLSFEVLSVTKFSLSKARFATKFRLSHHWQRPLLMKSGENLSNARSNVPCLSALLRRL